MIPQSASIITQPRDSGLGLDAGDSFDKIKADLALLYGPTTGQVLFAGNINYTGASGPDNSKLYWSGAISGVASTAPNGVISPFNLTFNDAVDTTTNGGGNLTGLSVTVAPALGHTGSRTGIQGFVTIHATPAVLSSIGYLGVLSLTRVDANLTGTSGIYQNYRGNVFGGNSNVFTTPNATFLETINGHEFDVSLVTGASTADKFGISIVQTNTDAVRGTYDDAAISIQSGGNGTSTWFRGVSFGGYAHRWPFGADSTLVGVQQQQVARLGVQPIALYGVDFRLCAFQLGGAAFISTGFQVDPTGQVVPQTATVATLPVGILGGRATATDSTATIAAGFGAVVGGGGTNTVPVFWDGANWRIGG